MRATVKYLLNEDMSSDALFICATAPITPMRN